MTHESRPERNPGSSGVGDVRGWAIVLLAAAGVAGVLGVIGAPSPVLFGALFGSLAVAVSRPDTPALPRPLSVLGQALLGAATGAVVDLETLIGFARDAGPVAVAVVLTVAVSILLGQILRVRGVSPATATFAFIAGGASGVTAIAGELGADDRVVAVVQYLRVLIILVGMPVVAALAFGAPVAPPQMGGVAAEASAFWGQLTWQALTFTALCVAAGLALARVVPFPAGNLLLPLIVAAAAAVTGVTDAWLGVAATAVPAPLEEFAFALIGLQVGLRFTRASLRHVVRLLPLATAIILGLIAVSAVVGMVLADAMGISRLDGYLATTPGGLYAVLVTARLAGGDVTFVLVVQIVRLFLVLGLAPVLAAHYRRREARRRSGAGGAGARD